MRLRFRIEEIVTLLAGVIMLMLLAASTHGQDGAIQGAATGRLRVRVTDAPYACDALKEARIVITKVLLLPDAWQEDQAVSLMGDRELARSFDLLRLRNGGLAELASSAVPQGTYRELRIFLDKMGCSLTLEQDGARQVFSTADRSLRFPDGLDDGIRVSFEQTPIVVSASDYTDAALDFDLGLSLWPIPADAEPKDLLYFELRPVVRGFLPAECGRIQGRVVTPLRVPENEALGVFNVPLEGALVTAVQAGKAVASTSADSVGRYCLLGLPEGIYELRCSKPGCRPGQALSASTGRGQTTYQNFELEPVAGPGEE